MYRPLWIEINLKALRNNFARIKNIVGPGVRIMATLKQEAYGHGLVALANELSLSGVDSFGLGSLEEAITLREKGFKEPILVLSSCLESHAKVFVDYNITPTVMDLVFAGKLDSYAKRKQKKIPVHIKIDTGMGRLGIWHKETINFINKLSGFKSLNLEGLYTHFPSADTDIEFTRNQIEIFNGLVGYLEERGIIFKYLHCANSIALINYREAHFNLVRPGLILYGIKPFSLNIKLEPVLSLKSRVIFIKKVEKGRSIGYGRTFIIKRPAFVATVSVGYADGYPWNLSNRAKVIVNNKLFDLVGRVCMDHIMVNLGAKTKIKVGEPVTLIGRDKDVKVTVENLASWADTIPYEIVSRLSLKIPRIYKYSADKSHSAYSHSEKGQRCNPGA